MKTISSLKNPLVKNIIQLQEKSKVRKDQKLFIIEGGREIQRAIEGGIILETLLFGDHLASYFEAEKLCLFSDPKPEIIGLTREVHLRLCVREGTEAFIAVARMKNTSLDQFEILAGKDVFLLVAESPEKPGNIGALLRTADGAGVDGVIIANPKTDLFNPNVVRSSLGCIFTLPVFMADGEEVIAFLKKNNIHFYCASLESSVAYTGIQYPGRVAIVVGTEDKGLSQEWTEKADANILIPMLGKADSLNVSVSAGILLYEVLRQKNSSQGKPK